MRRLLGDRLRSEGFEVREAASGRAALEETAAGGVDLVVLDLRLPDIDGLEVIRRMPEDRPPVVVLTAHGTIEGAVEAMRLGAEDFVVKPSTPEHLRLVLNRALEWSRLRTENRYLREELGKQHVLVTGGDERMASLLETARRAAVSDATVLIQGESGTGKEVLARWIHRHSGRSEKPFVHIDCVGLTQTFFESDLFGHEKGAFTGAIRKKLGRAELARGGTLFLDEVGDISSAIQAKLLRFSQSGEFERMGDPKTRRVDVRIIAATNRDLEREVRAGHFREDLFFRLAVIRLVCPPLRERPGEIPALVRHFVALYSRRSGRKAPRLTKEALGEFFRRPWPGNIRELANAVERAMVMAGEGPLEACHLPEPLLQESDLLPVGRSLEEASRAFRRDYIRKSLEITGGNQTRAAEILGITRPYLNRLVKELGLK
ncbi:MAG: sigma-54-dependent transcriptional regulator [Planctomycetota bacterium]